MMAKRLLALLWGGLMALISPAIQAQDIAKLMPDQNIADFRVANIYENGAGQAMGARFYHKPSGFVLDLLRIQSVPQAFIWVNSFPPSDMGEPHTCEHLMLGKGTRGRYVASLEEMSLGNSSAFTAQLQTCYHYHTAAGADVFYNLTEAKLEALIHPDFSDEEIRREVCNMGYSVDPSTGAFNLEEKGTVYAEMVSSFERPWGNLGRELGILLYGPGHPLSNDAGGYPDDIRKMVPSDMRKFIAQNYHLSNMGMIVSVPDDIAVEDYLEHLSEILKRVEPDAIPGKDPATADEHLPPPMPGPAGQASLVDFPSQNNKEPGLIVYAWPADLEYDNNDGYILELLMSNLASGETSTLYRKFIDSQTRVMDLGANSVFEWLTSDNGHPIYLGFSNVKVEALNKPTMDTLRLMIFEELKKIAAFADGSPELESFNEKARSRIIDYRRDLRYFLNTPPGFGFRGTGSRWLEHLKHLQKTSGFKKRLTLDDELGFAEKKISSGKNFWREYISKFGLLERVPYAVATRPNTDLLAETEKAGEQRIDNFVNGLEKQYNVKSRDEAEKLFKQEYDVKSQEIDSAAASIPMPKFIDNPPLTLDDQLHYAVEKMPGGENLVSSTFENMTSATVGLAFRMDVIPESLLIYASVLPTLFTEVGVIKDGHTYSYDEMKEAVRREIMDLRAYYSVNYFDERVELVVRAAGSDSAESLEAMKWLEAILFNPYWTEANLPRLRDMADVAISNLRNTMRGSEESWVDDPANAYWRQSDPLLLSTSSFLTEIHNFHRFRWLLKNAGSQGTEDEFSNFLADLSATAEKLGRNEMTALLAQLTSQSLEKYATPVARNMFERFNRLSPKSKTLAADAIHDLTQSLADIPDSSLAGDIQYLCAQMDADLRVPPSKALQDLNNVMSLVRHQDIVRGFMIGNSENQKSLRPIVDGIIERLDKSPSKHQAYNRQPLIISRLQERTKTTQKPIFVGLINENTRQGVHINSAPCASFMDDDPEKLLRFLAARLYGGGGSHSMFMKTWGAGLAYSNGLRSNEFTGRIIYYAERCPDLAQTMQFVVNELKKAPRDPSLAEYAVAQAFGAFRSGSRYESRGEAMAADLADGVGPEIVARFRKGILALRDTPALYDKLWARMENVYGQILPGYGPRADSVEDAVYYIIGPESQFRSYEQYLKSVEGNFPLFRIYPRDYWIVRPNTNALGKPQ